MRILVLDTYYPPFLRAFYASRPGLERAPYDEQLDALTAECFGTFDAYSANLRSLGHEAAEVVVNCLPLQATWSAENGLRTPSALLRPLLERAGRAVTRVSDVLHRIVLAQTRAFAPEVVYVQDIGFHTARQVCELRAPGRLVVGQIASPGVDSDRLRAFDLVLTSFPHYVARFRSLGVRSAYLRLAFDERVLERLGASVSAPAGGVVFVGGLDPRVHGAGVRLIERVCDELGEVVEVYGYGASRLRRASPIRRCYRGEAWGLDMYRVLANAQIVLNRHIDAADGYSNNMRLYEATGVGAALVTDRGHNLGALFEPGREIEVTKW